MCQIQMLRGHCMKVGLIWVMLVTFTDLLLEVVEVVHEHQVFSHYIYFLDCKIIVAY